MKIDTQHIKRHLKFSFALQSQIKANYSSSSSSEKTVITRAITGKILKKYKLLSSVSNIVSLKRFRTHMNESSIIPSKQKRNQKKIESLRQDIFKFFVNDNNTTQSPNKKDFLTFKKEKKLKRYVNDSLLNLHKTFHVGYGKKISFPTFLSHKPFFVVYLKFNARDACACPNHLNMQLKLDYVTGIKYN